MTVAEITELAIGMGAAQKRSELGAFLDLVSGGQPSSVLEIGTLRGGTLAAWCQVAADDAVLVSVDLPGGLWGGGYGDGDVERLNGLARSDQMLHLIRGDSHDIEVLEQVDELFADTGIDLLFIDGDHSYDGVSRDFDDYGPLVTDGGLIVFHDILPHPDVPGCNVDAFWEEIKQGRTYWEFTDAADTHPVWGQWGGIGALVQ